MDQGKVKRLWPRTLSAEAAPPGQRGQRGVPRLASEPVSRRVRLTDRWQEGFLRLPARPRDRSLSYIVDGLGVYYDATAPSELEVMLEMGGWEDPALLARAGAGLAELRRLAISVDNDPRRLDLGAALARQGDASGKPVVVVVDQPRGDPSIGFGLAGEGRFTAMLDAAIAENPGAQVVVVMDPAAPYQSGPGHLDGIASEKGARLMRDPVAAWSVVEAGAVVYVVTSHVGFEAATAGRAVACFGMPFYAGWGFTDDRLDLARRTRERTAEEVFAASYLVSSRYFEPYGGEPCSFEEAVAILGLSVVRDRENAVRTLCLGFPAWKHPWLRKTLSSVGNAPVIARKGAAVAAGDLSGYGRVVAWSSRAPAETQAACGAAGVPLVRMEDGFLRSIGLGVALRPGASYVLDGTGIYYDATAPSDLERLLEAEDFDAAVLERAVRLRAAIVEARISKYNVGSGAMPALPKGRPVVLVAGQVEDDASIRLGATEIRTNAALLRIARERNPGAVIAFKPHPDVEAGLRPGRIAPAELERLADVVLRDVSAPDAIEAADSVEVITSLIGFEALLRGKPVTTHGLPFYAGWGLTRSPECPRRTRRLTLDELVAGALIRYTRYLDPRTGLACPPEVVVRRLADGDPGLARRAPTLEAALKHVWSLAFRRLLHRNG
ncbi:capsular polysaccharide biosynthesis protein [Methylobacterium sp. Leaf466]|uniref:capsular polysaccharide biosynthesis protein n=1 Tax=Methylobacterium sp. Leaf466 TaxID=1736386 RepID=UPI0006FDAB8F|nr:capsular polysaccharide biosynthesis protein [Methylobacterium sp. Leaf466]KQT85670.1 capsular biosynthesis protein [Methylobacterium sp. Leaf466]